MATVEVPTTICSECAATFPFSDDEKKFQMLRSIVGKPLRCPRCRGAELDKTVPGYSFPFLCMGCRVSSRVRFQPRGSVVMYCQQCLEVQLRAVTFEALPDARWARADAVASARPLRVERV